MLLSFAYARGQGVWPTHACLKEQNWNVNGLPFVKKNGNQTGEIVNIMMWEIGTIQLPVQQKDSTETVELHFMILMKTNKKLRSW